MEKELPLVSEVPVTGQGNLACPFCGSVKLSKTTPVGRGVSWIECEICGATGPNSLPPEVGWNQRAFDEAIYINTTTVMRVMGKIGE